MGFLNFFLGQHDDGETAPTLEEEETRKIGVSIKK